MAKIVKTLMSGHFVKIFKVQQALLYKGLQLCRLIYRVRMVITAWNFHTTLRPLQGVDFSFGRWVGEGVGPTHGRPQKTFFQFSFFCNIRSKNHVLATHNFLGRRPPHPRKLPPPLKFFHFIGSKHRIPIMFRWLNPCNPSPFWKGLGPRYFNFGVSKGVFWWILRSFQTVCEKNISEKIILLPWTKSKAEPCSEF